MSADSNETYMEVLHNKLKKKFDNTSNSTAEYESNKKVSDIKMKLHSSHGWCFIENKDREIKFHCSIVNMFGVDKNELFVYFYETDKPFIFGRTFSEEEVIQSIYEWIIGIKKEKVYTKYDFIDGNKKRLEDYLSEIKLVVPELQEKCSKFHIKREIQSNVVLIEAIQIELNERNCIGFFWGDEKHPRFRLSWNETDLFEISSTNMETNANLISDWIINFLSPLQIKEKYKQVDFREPRNY